MTDTRGPKPSVGADAGQDKPAQPYHPPQAYPAPSGPATAQGGKGAAAQRKSRTGVRTAPRTRKARLRVAKADPWSVMKVSFLLSIALGICTIVAAAVLWMVMDAMGVFSTVGGTISEATGSNEGNGFDLQSFLSLPRVLIFTSVIAVIDVVLATALATLGPRDIEAVEHAEAAELARQAARFRGDRPRVPLDGRTVIVVDDGIATGATAAAACEVVRAQGAARVVLAVPVAPPDAVARLGSAADEVVCLATPHAFRAVGEWYQDFSQTPDEEVVFLLARAAADPTGRPPVRTVEVEVEVDGGGPVLVGDLALPEGAGAVVVFAHGSGSGRRSPRNRSVAADLNRAGLATPVS
ncbi:DUF3566 domain-containing protein, partial [Streptomyces sp. NPDC058394]|uniref:DUF3566 domain-containing protein n=1 Tax=Streptomyces sp. NPDC058394 TaxID=3346477 RepID=UPI003659471D